jgi:hypothetical protein
MTKENLYQKFLKDTKQDVEEYHDNKYMNWLEDLIDKRRAKQLILSGVISRLKDIESYDLNAELNEYNAQTPELYIEEEKMGKNGDWIKKTELDAVINSL